jgi:hypothetical protein
MLQNNAVQFISYASVTVNLYAARSAQGVPNHGMLFYEPLGVKKCCINIYPIINCYVTTSILMYIYGCNKKW